MAAARAVNAAEDGLMSQAVQAEYMGMRRDYSSGLTI